MTKPQLSYFKARALGQFPRVLLSYFSVDYEENYIEKIDENIIDDLKYGQLPLFKDANGFKFVQSMAISKYIATQLNFVGKTPEEKALVDETISAVHIDVVNFIIRVFRGVEEKEKIQELIIPRFFEKWNQVLGEKKYLAGGDSYTLADLYVYVAYEYVGYVVPSAGEHLYGGKFPHLETLKEHFESNKGVAEYIKNRPVTERKI
ncbi:hypothetical protein ACTA71_009180 [Dictyostelium dimigraforme]